MAIISMGRTHQLDEKFAWKTWMRLGSVDKMVKQDFPELMNPLTGRLYAKRTIRCAAYRWAFTHQEESRKDWEQMMRDAGEPPSDAAWKAWLAAKAKDAYRYQAGTYQKFVEDNGLGGL